MSCFSRVVQMDDSDGSIGPNTPHALRDRQEFLDAQLTHREGAASQLQQTVKTIIDRILQDSQSAGHSTRQSKSVQVN
jgi:hypothetical protein